MKNRYKKWLKAWLLREKFNATEEWEDIFILQKRKLSTDYRRKQ